MSRHSIKKGLLAGLAGGLAASWLMNKFQSVANKAFEGTDKGHGAQSIQPGSPNHGVGAELQKLGLDDPEDNAAERTANIIAAKLFDHRLSDGEKKSAGRFVHYAFGATSGLMYGAASELLPLATAGAGTMFGATIWIVADEIVVPALGLSQPAGAYPASKLAYGLASHL